MDPTLVYEAARDGSSFFSIATLAPICVAVGLLLMAIPPINVIRRQPEKRGRGIVSVALLAVIGVVVLVGMPRLEASLVSNDKPETIEGVVGSVSPTLVTVGGMKVMVSCSSSTGCPALRVGDNARVAYVEDSGPETDALAVRIWKLAPR